MHCPACNFATAPDDNYCRKCGTALAVIDVPAVSGEARAVTAWQEARPVVARGVMLLAAGAILRYLIGRTAKAALSGALTAGGQAMDPRRLIPFTGGRTSSRYGGDEVEFFWYRRVRR